MGLFDYFQKSTFTTSASEQGFLVGKGEENQYTGHIDHGCELRAGFKELIHGSLFRTNEYPAVARRAIVLNKILSEYGWLGNIAHARMEKGFHNERDRIKKDRSYLEPTILDQESFKKIDDGWDESRHYDEKSYLQAWQEKRRGDNSPVWLREHAITALAGRTIDSAEDNARKAALRERIRPSIEHISSRLGEMIEFTPMSRWYMIEGKLLDNGDLVGGANQTQEELRNTRDMPSFTISVDGTEIVIFSTPDFVYRSGDGLVIADLKTGKTREAYSYQLGLYGYYIIEKYGGFDPEQISFRLMYPSVEPENRYQIEQFDRKKLEEVKKTVEGKVREILKLFVPLSAKDATTPEALQALIDMFPLQDAVNIWTLAKFARDGVWPKSMPEVREPYPLEFYKGWEPRRFRPDVPTPAALMAFMTNRLSPYEFGRGVKHKFPDIEQRIDALVQKRIQTNQKVDNCWVNQYLRLEVSETISAEDFLRDYRVNHLRIPFAHLLRPTGGLEIPENCRGCTFFNICDPGKHYYVQFKQENNEKRGLARNEGIEDLLSNT